MEGMVSKKTPIKSFGNAISSSKCGSCLNILKKNILNSVGSDIIRSIYSSNGICAAAELIVFEGSAFELSYRGTIFFPTTSFKYAGVHFWRAGQLLVNPLIISGRRGLRYF